MFIIAAGLLLTSPALLPMPDALGQQPAESVQGKKSPPRDSPSVTQDDVGDDEIYRVDTDLVLVDVTVTDAQGRPVRDLRPEDFKLYEDGAERPISFFNVEKRGGQPRPVAVVFAVDISGSMTGEELRRMGDAMRAFAQHLAGREAVFAVMSFGMSAKVLQSFSGEARKLDRALERLAHEPNGLSTHTYDAIDDAIRLLVRKAPRTRERRLMKRAVVVITDGFPVGDTVAPKTVIERANDAETSVYTVLLPSFSRLQGNRKPLMTPLEASGLTEKTGGKNFYATGGDFSALFRALAEEITASYVLAFYPDESAQTDGKFRRVKIETRGDYTIKQNREGYQLKRNEK